MQPKDKKEFVDRVCALLTFYEKPVTDDILGIWWNALSNLTIEEVAAGFSAHVQHPDQGRFAPKPADIIALCNGKSDGNAVSAWAKVEKAIKSSGAYYDVVFDDPLIHICVEQMGGWLKLCNTQSEKDLIFVGNDFKAKYKSMNGSLGSVEKPPCLRGLINIENRKSKHPMIPPRVYGDRQKAEQVYLSLERQEKVSGDGSFLSLPSTTAKGSIELLSSAKVVKSDGH